MRSALPLLLLAAALPSGAQISPERMRRVFPPDIVANDPGFKVRVETDNETTRVLRINLDGARQIPNLAYRPGVLVCLTDCHLSLGSEEIHLRAGQTRWIPEGRRETRNIANGRVELLYIESKQPQN